MVTKSLEIDYYPQQLEWDCGISVVQMIQRESVAEAIRQRLLQRHGRTPEQFPSGLRLHQNTLAWLLHPMRCHWHQHLDSPIQFDQLRRQIDRGYPVILMITPVDTIYGNELTRDEPPRPDETLGHYLLMVGYSAQAAEQTLLVLDPQPTTQWKSKGQSDPERQGQPGHHLIRYGAIAEGLEVVPNRLNRLAGQFYRWTATCLLQDQREV